MADSGKTATPESHDVQLGINYPVPYVQLSQSKMDQIRWVSADGNPFLIVFEEGSPFEKWYFVVSSERGARAESKPVRKDLKVPEAGLEFKYSVISDGWKLDPKTGVKP